VTRRVAIAVLAPPRWCPPGVDPIAWRLALAEDVLDVLGLMAEVDPALAVLDGDEPGELGWPGLRRYVLPVLDVPTVLAAAAGDGYDQAALVPADAPDLPGMMIAKLFRPLTSKPVAAAGATGSDELIGLGSVLPAPHWLPPVGLDQVTPQSLRRLAPQATDVAPANGWHRLLGPADLARLDPRLEGWEATRALLTAHTARA
jgi:hypothetical protein